MPSVNLLLWADICKLLLRHLGNRTVSQDASNFMIRYAGLLEETYRSCPEIPPSETTEEPRKCEFCGAELEDSES